MATLGDAEAPSQMMLLSVLAMIPIVVVVLTVLVVIEKGEADPGEISTRSATLSR